MTKTTNIRIRLTDDELADIDTVRQFLGLRSVSAAAGRLAVWNARILGRSLRSDTDDSLEVIGTVIGDATRLALRKYIEDSERGARHVQG